MKHIISDNYLLKLFRSIQEPKITYQRQPIHTVYGGANRFTQKTFSKLQKLSLDYFHKYFSSPVVLSSLFDIPSDLAEIIYNRAQMKLEKQAIEDFRIDFEDGLGIYPDMEEDYYATNAANALFQTVQNKTIPPFVGIRIKSLSQTSRFRAVHTLDLFLSKYLSLTDSLPSNFVITLPKVTSLSQVEVLVQILEELENNHIIPDGSLKIDLMVETPQILVGKGGLILPQIIEACKGRLVSLAYGAYDFTSLMGVVASEQSLHHSYSTTVRHIMKIASSSYNIRLSDGATNLIPIDKKENKLSDQLIADIIKLNFNNVTKSLEEGFYQSWDLHPSQIPIRYIANYTFFLTNLPIHIIRMNEFLDSLARVSQTGGLVDDKATAEGLYNYFKHGLSIGALMEEDLNSLKLSIEELKLNSLEKIIDKRL
jgi:citrate lyase beta subunit